MSRESGVYNSLFYRGILVSRWNRQPVFTYNIKKSITLTEDRTPRYGFEIQEAVADTVDILADSGEIDICTSILCAPQEFAERREINFDGIFGNAVRSVGFLNLVGDLLKTRAVDVCPSAYLAHTRLTRSNLEEIVEISLSDIQRQSIQTAVAFCAQLGFPVDAFPIIPVRSLGRDVFGLAKNGTILISESCLDQGTKYIAATLIEEWAHLTYGFDDCSRSFQNWLFQRLVSLGEQHVWKKLL